MRFIPAREDVNTLDPYRSGNTLQWDAIESVPPGHVIVVDSRGDTSAASGGDMLMTRAWKRGAAGFVTDGGLRDGHVLSQLPFPTYAAAVTITTRAAWHHVADLQVPIGCGGVAVYPGDVLVADRDGIIVIPRSLAAEIADPSLEQEKLEAYVATKIQAGEPLAGNYPPGEAIKAEYKATLAQHRRRTAAPCRSQGTESICTDSHEEGICLRPNVFRRRTAPLRIGGTRRHAGEWAMISSSTRTTNHAVPSRNVFRWPRPSASSVPS